MDVPVKKIRQFNKEFLGYFSARNQAVMKEIAESGLMTEEQSKLITDSAAEFKKTFLGAAEQGKGAGKK